MKKLKDELAELYAEIGVDAAWEGGDGNPTAAGALMSVRVKLGKIMRVHGIEPAPYPLRERLMADSDRHGPREATGHLAAYDRTNQS